MTHRYTDVQQLAKKYAAGEATAEEVIAAVRAAPPVEPQYRSTDYDSLGARMQTDDVNDPNLTGWGGVTSVYIGGGMTDAQYSTLFRSYTKT